MAENVQRQREPASLAERYGDFQSADGYGPDDPVLRALAQCSTVEVYEKLRPLFPAAHGAWLQLRNVLMAKGWQVLPGKDAVGERNAAIMEAMLGAISDLPILLEEAFEGLWTGYAVAVTTSVQDLVVEGRTVQAPWYVRAKPARLWGFTTDRRLVLTEGFTLATADDERIFNTNPELGPHPDQLRFLLVSLSTDDPYGSSVAVAPHVYQTFRLWRGALKHTTTSLLRALGIVMIDDSGPPPMPGSPSGMKSQAGYTPEEADRVKSSLKGMITALNETGVLQFPPGISGTIESVDSFGDQAVKVLRYLDEQATRAILSVALTTTLDGQGSRAAAQVQLGPMLAACKAAGRKIAASINRWMWGWLELAVGASIPPAERPRFSFNLSEATNLDLLRILVDEGIPIDGAALALEAGVELAPDDDDDLVIRRGTPSATRPAPPPEEERPGGEAEPEEEGDEPQE